MLNLSFIRKLSNFVIPQRRKLTHSIRNISGVTPTNLHLYRLALTHSSASTEISVGIKRNNERLEFLGDAVVDLIVADILYNRYPMKDEGFLTELRSKIVNGTTLDSIARKLGFDRLLITDSRVFSQPLRNRNVFADALEAFIGAVYLDKGYSETYKFVKDRMLALYIDFDALVATETNFKSKVLEWSQKNNKVITYELVQNSEGKHNRKFVLDLHVDQEKMTTGEGFTKKIAEQDAARKYYEKYLLGSNTTDSLKN